MQNNKLWFVALVTLFAVSAGAQNTFPNSGNVGIGTTSPTYPLQLAPGTALRIEGGSNSTDNSNYFSFGGNGAFGIDASGIINGRFVVLSNGNVGIGTAVPNAALQVDGGFSKFQFNTQTWPATDGGGGLVVGWNRTGLSAETNFYNVFPNAVMAFQFTQMTGTNTGTNLMTMLGNGYVGIGTTTPAYPLDVAGQIHSSGGFVFQDGTTQTTAFIPANCGADYAEAVDVTGDRTKYEPGDILVIDPNAPGKFLKSNQTYSTLVSGIYSTKPGFVGRLEPANSETSKTEVPMAMVGRVPTKVSTENGPITVGDLLVTSSTIGYAMKGTDRSQMLGAVIGKALGSLDSGTGVIEVLVTLQ
jgi:hypothetical protein